MGQLTGPRGWAFLVARGRRRGYSSILAPDFLVQNKEYGILPQVATTNASGSATTVVKSVATRSSGDICLVYRAHRLTYADLGEAGTAGRRQLERHNQGDLLLDEHGRPIDIVFGFVTHNSRVARVDEADVRVARQQALHAYVRFLADEFGFEVAASAPFAVRSTTQLVPARVPGAVPSSLPPKADLAHARRRRPDSRLRAPHVLIAGVLLVALAVAVIALWPRLHRPALAVEPSSCERIAIDVSADCSVVVTSEGAVPLEITNVKLGLAGRAADTTAWTIVNDTCSASSLSPRKTCNVVLHFTSRSGKPWGAQLTIAHNAGEAVTRMSLWANWPPMDVH